MGLRKRAYWMEQEHSAQTAARQMRFKRDLFDTIETCRRELKNDALSPSEREIYRIKLQGALDMFAPCKPLKDGHTPQ